MSLGDAHHNPPLNSPIFFDNPVSSRVQCIVRGPTVASSGRRYTALPHDEDPDILTLPVQDIATQDCLLFLWAVHFHVLDALSVIRAWGFT